MFTGGECDGPARPNLRFLGSDYWTPKPLVERACVCLHQLRLKIVARRPTFELVDILLLEIASQAAMRPSGDD